MRKIAIALSSITLFATTASSNMLLDAITQGYYEGSVGAYMMTQDNKETRDKSYLNTNLSLKYITAELYNFSLGVEGKGNLKLAEKHSGDWEYGASNYGLGKHANNLLLTQAYLKYELQQGFIFKAGRYEADLPWMKYYQQGAIMEIDAIPDVLITLAYSDKKAESGINTSEKFHNKFDDFNGYNKGIYTIDIKDNAIEGFDFNPYFYQVPDVIKFYGLKTGFDTNYGGIKLEYARSNFTSKFRNSEDQENGYIGHTEIFGKAEVTTLAAGAIVTSKKGGAEGMWYFGDTITPFEDANQTYSKDARTLYLSLKVNIEERFDFTALYGYVRYDDKVSGMEEREFDLVFNYNFTEDFKAGFKYIKVKADSKETRYPSYNKYIASVEYKF